MLRDDLNGKPVVFVDVDSTLADTTHRQHVIQEARERGEEPDWVAYSLLCEDDAPLPAIKLTQLLASTCHIVLITSRYDVAMMPTMRWLYKHNVGFNEVIMQSADDPSPIDLFKVESIERWLDRHAVSAPALIIEDWPPIKEALDARGWTTMLVNPNFHPDEYVEAHTKVIVA